ncbi:class I SAM-dependent methyltransferase [Clostridium sp.]|uniref:class I SAM-dependent DNA methyltransferase n=1 Tax=Clostridium sp. TaxID=1506 RepID=UPI002FC78D6E
MNFDDRAITWDDEYRVKRAKIISQEIKKSIPIKENCTALEFGCGTGLISFNLHDTFKAITLIDTSKGMIDVVNLKKEQYKIHNMVAYETDISKNQMLNEKYDVIYTSMALHHVEDINGTLIALYNLMNPEGYLCIVDLVKDDGSFHKAEKDFRGHHGFEAQELKGKLQDIGLKDINSRVFYTDKKSIGDEKIDYFLFIMIGKKK